MKEKPLIAPDVSLPELTLKVIIISIFLAAFLAAANAYLALKIGTTISASIPASVFALGLLRLFKSSNVLETNMIQTAASAGEAIAAAIAFTLPAMIILGVWKSFPFWEIAVIASLGGAMGVLFSVPLRRVLLNLPTLKFPEGTAIGNVLKASTEGGSQMKLMLQGGAVGSLISLAQDGLQLIGNQMDFWGRMGGTIAGLSLGFAPAPLAAGFIVGFEAGASIFAGLVVGWLIILPYIISQMHNLPTEHFYAFAMQVWSAKLRYVGVGVMLVGGIWTLIRLIKPVFMGLKVSFDSVGKINKGKRYKILRTEHDIPLKWVIWGTVGLSVLVFALIWYMVNQMGFNHDPTHDTSLCVIILAYILVVGFILTTICGYVVGLIGSTNNPLSGVLIIALLFLGLIFMFTLPHTAPADQPKACALMILITSVVACIACISVDNLQDLKAGQMVGATPWKQQLILIIGTVTASLVTAPVLEMLFQAYGLGGVFPRPGMDPSHMLAAPQSGLMAAIAGGFRNHNLPWDMIGIGGVFAVFCILFDEWLRKRGMRFAVLAVGLGVYLPPQIMSPLVIGSLLNLFVRLRIKASKSTASQDRLEGNQQAAVLLACGLVAGAAIMGVLLAIPFVILGSSDALSIVPAGFSSIASLLGLLSIIGILMWIWKVCGRSAH